MREGFSSSVSFLLKVVLAMPFRRNKAVWQCCFCPFREDWVWASVQNLEETSSFLESVCTLCFRSSSCRFMKMSNRICLLGFLSGGSQIRI